MEYDKYIKISWTVVLDNNICPSAKLLYGILYVLSKKKGYCYANNNYLSDMLNLGTRTITRLLKELSDNNYISLEYKNRFQRKIFINNVTNTSIDLDEIF